MDIWPCCASVRAGAEGITPRFALFHMEPLGEVHLVKELLWNLGHTRVVLGAAWGQGCLHRAAGVVTALCTGTGTQTPLGSLVQPSPGLAEQGPGSPGAGAAAAPLCSRGGHSEPLEPLPFFFWERVKAVLAAEQWLHPAPSRHYHTTVLVRYPKHNLLLSA